MKTRRKILYTLATAMAFLAVSFCSLNGAQAATPAVTWTLQPELYHKYDKTPLSPRDIGPYEHLKTTDIDAVNPNWIKLDGVYHLEISSGGRNRYTKQIVSVPPAIDECKAQFVCHMNWGWIVNINENQALKCTSIKITKEQAAFFDSAISTNSGTESACPKWPK